MKAHKYWSIGALICMAMAMYSGFNMKSKKSHMYWGCAASGCMLMAMYTGYRMIHRKPKKAAAEAALPEGGETAEAASSNDETAAEE